MEQMLRCRGVTGFTTGEGIIGVVSRRLKHMCETIASAESPIAPYFEYHWSFA